MRRRGTPTSTTSAASCAWAWARASLPRDGILHGLGGMTGGRPTGAASARRWKGVADLYGDQLRQARLDDWIFQGILDVEHLPG
jgi:hypothetical protein